MRCVKLCLRESARLVVAETVIFWQKARIPVREPQHCIAKLEALYNEWRGLQKHCKRQNQTQVQKEYNFKEKLADLFDIAHANALETIKIEEDRQFLLSQRQKGRIGALGGIDKKTTEKERRIQRRLSAEEKRRKISNEDEVTTLSEKMDIEESRNNIFKVTPECWRGIENSLTTLVLARNSITFLPFDLFSGLPVLETIDLRGNNLREIDPSVFRDGMIKLANLILADNQLTTIPYQAVSYLKVLRNLDLSYNTINKMQPSIEPGIQTINYNFQLNLDELRLEYNQLTNLEPFAFQYFSILNSTYVDGNPLTQLQENAFRPAKITELYIRGCQLKEISPEAFNGLENSLEILDLSGNRIEVFPGIQALGSLKTLSLKDNLLLRFDPVESFNTLQLIIFQLDLSGVDNTPVTIQDLRRLRNMRMLHLSKLSQSTLSPDDFLDFGMDLEELRVTFAGLQTIQNNAFKHVHGVKTVDLSENIISTIEAQAFTDIQHSLVTLKLAHALSSSVQDLPADALRGLVCLEELDFSNNRIRILPEASFHFLKNLKTLYLHDNLIEIIPKGIFQGDIHRNLQQVYLSFNSINSIQMQTFVDLPELKQLHLDDNQITSVDKRAFMNLEHLRRLNLKGNQIAKISYEAFQNLPELEDLDLSYNYLETFDFFVLDQVGSLGILHLNISHNNLLNLTSSSTMNLGSALGMDNLQSNVKVLDLSFNNITYIARQYFRPTEPFLTHLYLSHNQILNATKDVFGNMPHLQVLDISHNSLYELDFDAFRSTRRLQVFIVSHNRIAEVPNDLFRFLSRLRVVDFSHNRFRSLPDNLFRAEGLERLDISHNFLSKMSLTSISVASAMTLCELDLSWNSISTLSHGGLLSRFQRLTFLDLSYNRLAQIDAGAFTDMPKLSHLNLGHNCQLALEANGLSFLGLEYTLLDLNLENITLTYIPALPTHNLVHLSLAFNSLSTVAPEIAGNISSLQRLNLDYNDLTAVPIVTHSLKELRFLSMAGNPISAITNTSLLGAADHLEELDLRNINLTTFETGAFCKLLSLRILKINLYQGVKGFNIPKILQYNQGLRILEVNVDTYTDIFDNVMSGQLPMKLRNITFTGTGLKEFGSHILQGVWSPFIHLGVKNTSITRISANIFENTGWARNISLDVRDNPLLEYLGNPSTGSKPDLSRSTFLIDLKLARGKWSCDCDLGWVEVWQRKRRQYLCGPSPSIISSFRDEEYICRHTDDDLRLTLCANKNNQSLIDILKKDIECGWSSASKLQQMTGIFAFLGCFSRLCISFN